MQDILNEYVKVHLLSYVRYLLWYKYILIGIQDMQ